MRRKQRGHKKESQIKTKFGTGMMFEIGEPPPPPIEDVCSDELEVNRLNDNKEIQNEVI